MSRTLLVVSDRPSFVATCEAAPAAIHAHVRSIDPAALAAESLSHAAVLVDADSEAFRAQDDELLVTLGFARAQRATVGVVTSRTQLGDVDELVAELCPGSIARTPSELDALVARVIKRAESSNHPRFEYVTVSPRADELLAILNHGGAALLPRPCTDQDDGSDVVGIDLSPDASAATVTLQSGATITLFADNFAARGESDANAVATDALDSAKVGSRLRELRKAAGLTQAELARRTGIHRPNIARVEAGRHTPSLDTLARIAAAIGVPATRVLSAD